MKNIKNFTRFNESYEEGSDLWDSIVSMSQAIGIGLPSNGEGFDFSSTPYGPFIKHILYGNIRSKERCVFQTGGRISPLSTFGNVNGFRLEDFYHKFFETLDWRWLKKTSSSRVSFQSMGNALDSSREYAVDAKLFNKHCLGELQDYYPVKLKDLNMEDTKFLQQLGFTVV